MAGDKLNRVKSIRRWLDKAEESYSSDKEISGEINLIMAQAEMQRLKEHYPHKLVKKWGIRLGAFALAIGIMFGMNTALTVGQDAGPVILPQKKANLLGKEIVAKEIEAGQTTKEISARNTVKMDTETESPVGVHARKETMIQEVPVIPVPPVMSQQELQSVVSEAGRALRGQS